ncbi:MAG: type I-U CRISPR-associated protein Cas5/Cas6 [Nitrospirae bacterium]|nr:type I-U CRISPR-associated protein Cas5/Cas6 [Candidatus Manganitrophaceae bacterium]
MITLNIRFTAGRYHATPWGRHVNEGAIEWPPSPWRILRGLIAAWHRKFSPDIPEPAVRDIVENLTALPLFHLPKATLGHTRHFMPQRDPLGRDKTKIFDAFISILPDDPLSVIWPSVTLEQDQLLRLQRLTSGLGYLGRAESWVSIEASDKWDGVSNCKQIENGEKVEGERVRTMAALTPEEYSVWLTHFSIQPVGPELATKKKTRSKKDLLSAPTNLWDALHAETSDLQKQGWSFPPGSRWVDYARPDNAFQIVYQRRPMMKKEESYPTVARYALAGPVLPRLTDSLFIGELMRQTLIKRTSEMEDSLYNMSIFSGKTVEGSPSEDKHSHAFYLPSDEDRDGKLDHITVYAEKRFDDSARIALNQVRELRSRGGYPVYTVLLSLGHPENYGGFDGRSGQTPQLARSKVWVSTTPYMLTRHPKKNGKDSPEIQLRLELTRRGLPEPIKIDRLDSTIASGKKIRWLEFKRIRTKGGGQVADSRGYGFRIEFPVDVSGPIALGYGCHFGLGQFTAIKE